MLLHRWLSFHLEVHKILFTFVTDKSMNFKLFFTKCFHSSRKLKISHKIIQMRLTDFRLLLSCVQCCKFNGCGRGLFYFIEITLEVSNIYSLKISEISKQEFYLQIKLLSKANCIWFCANKIPQFYVSILDISKKSCKKFYGKRW